MEFFDYIIYTDGGYSNVHDVGAFAYVMLDGKGNEVRRGAWKTEHETNNRVEIKAIIAALSHIPTNNASVKVVSDSQYALYTCEGKWQRKANTDLFPILDKIVLEKNLRVTYEWVKGHNGNQYNELCDTMCNEAVGFDLNAEFEKYKKKPTTKEITASCFGMQGDEALFSFRLPREGYLVGSEVKIIITKL